MTTAIRNRILDLAYASVGLGGPEPWATEAGIVGASKSVSWCGLFVRAIWRRAGLDVPDWRIGQGNVHYLRKTVNPEPGDVVCWRGANGHQSIFARMDGESMVVSIDGNTSGKDITGRDVYATVAQKRRPIADVLAFYGAPIDPKAR